ncbi:MAG: DUF1849 family protein [Alphaproteobacteria bacterium]|nr:DUF1849 family protein [Alphaproteobacteria bacterium]
MMLVMRRYLLLVLLAMTPGWASAQGVTLASHKAVYELRMASTRPGSGIGGYEGRMALEWVDTCLGYVTRQRLVSRLFNSEGGEVSTDLTINMWESPEGKEFRFKSKTLTDGDPSEEVDGKAETGGGAPAFARFTKPEGQEVDLPEGVIFPTEHSKLLIKAARGGEDTVPAVVFDGSGPDKVFQIVAFVSRPLAPDRAERPELRGHASWRFRMAYFPVRSADRSPEYEIGYRMYDNGIATDLEIDYGDFSVKGTLSSLEVLPKSDCR